MLERLFIPSITLFLLGVALRMSLRLLYGARGPTPDDGVYLFMRILSWGLLIVPASVFFVATANWLSLVLFAAAIEGLFELILARRSVQRHSVWGLLLASLGGERPVAQSLRFHEARFTGVVGRWFRRLLADLDRGVAWPTAVAANRRALPREAPAYAGVLGSTASVAALDYDESRDIAFLEVRQQIIQRFAYLATVGAMMVAVLLFVMIKIVPSYQDIFADFDLPIPAVTQAFIAFNERFASPFGASILIALAAIVVVTVVMGIFYLCDAPVLRPLTDRLAFSQHRAHVLRLLAAAFEQGLPIHETLARLESGGSAYPSSLVRRRLRVARDRAVAGEEWSAALHQSKLISATDAATLRAAQQAGNLPWAMRLLADRKLRLMAFRWAAVQHVLFTLIILLLGLMVFWFAVAMFYPLTQLILNLA